MKNIDNNLKEQPVVIFVHIPKTAGTTLKHIIQFQFQPHNVFEFYRFKTKSQLEKYRNFSEAQKKTIKLISGHPGFGLHEFLQRPCTYITFLRDPIERTVSLYYYFQRRGWYQELTLKDFVQTYPGVHNGITNYLSGEMLKVQLADPLNRDRVNSQCSNQLKFELAKNHLKKHFKTIGLTERFDESLILLKKQLGWKIPFYKKSNVSTNRASIRDVPKDTLRLIESFNEFDIQLYEFAKEFFEELINQQGSSFEREVEEFKQANQSSQSKLHFKLNWFSNRLVYRLYQEIAYPRIGKMARRGFN